MSTRLNAAHAAGVIEDADGVWHDGIEAEVSVRRVLDSSGRVELVVCLNQMGVDSFFDVVVTRRTVGNE